MIFSKENESEFKAIVKQTLPKLFAVIFFSLHLINLSPDSSQNFNLFGDLTFQEITLDNDDDEQENCFVGIFYDFKYHPIDTQETILLITAIHLSIQKYSHLSRAPPKV